MITAGADNTRNDGVRVDDVRHFGAGLKDGAGGRSIFISGAPVDGHRNQVGY